MRRFYFNGQDSIDMGCFIVGSVQFPLASQLVENVEVEGSEVGDLTINTGSYKNSELEFRIRIINRSNIREQVKLVKRWLTDVKDRRLTFDNDRCYIVKRVNFSPYVLESVSCDLSVKFTTEPLLKVFNEVEYNVAIGKSFIRNEGDVTMSPTFIVEMSGSGNVNIMIADKHNLYSNEVQLRDVNGTITINNELREACNELGDSITLKMLGDWFNVPCGLDCDLTISGNNIKKVTVIKNERYDN